MKKLLLLHVFVLCLNSLVAQTPSWTWAKNGGGTDMDYSNAIATDAAGNSYITGAFDGFTATFGTYTLNNPAVDSLDIFIACYDANGSVQWAHSAGGIRNDEATSIAVDASGNIIITGYFFSDSITFGSYVLHNHSGWSDIFIAKYDSNGNVLWATNVGGFYDDRANDIVTDLAGNFEITGYFLADTLYYSPNEVVSIGSYDMFLAKYDSGGNLMWATGAGTTGDDRGQTLAVDDQMNVFVAGTFRTSPLIIGNDTLTYAGGAYTDIFIVKYNGAGSPTWAIAEGGTYLDEPNSLDVDDNGDIFMAAIVYSSSIVIGNDTLLNSGTSFYCEAVIAKYDANGNAVWAQNHGVATGNDIAYGITVDANGNAYLTGVHGNNIVFGSYTLNGVGLFVTKYSPTGSVQWAITVTDTYGYGITMGGSGDVIVTGFMFAATATFGSTTLNTAGSYDAFVARLSSSTGLTEFSDDIELHVYPNPASESVTISGLDENTSHNIRITNSLGQVVLEHNLLPGERIINVEVLSPGIYILKSKSEDGATTIADLLIN